MRWVTYHLSVIGGLSDVTVHEDRETATKFFNRNYGRYFELAGRERFDLPRAYGYAHRQFCGVSMRTFRKNFPTWNFVGEGMK